MAKHDNLKETLYYFYNNHSHLSRKVIFNRFRELGAPERSLNRWLCALEQKRH